MAFSVGDAVGGDTSLNLSWHDPILWVTRLSREVPLDSSAGATIHFQFVIPGRFADAGFAGSRKAGGRAQENFAAVEIALPEAAPPNARAYLLARMIHSTSLLSRWAARSGHLMDLKYIVHFLQGHLDLVSPGERLVVPERRQKVGDEKPDLEGRVTIVFSKSNREFPIDWVDSLAPTETAANAAIERTMLGSLEGTEVGEYGYQASFVGTDGLAIWSEIREIFDRAPVPWSQVRIETGLGTSEMVIERSETP